LPELRVGTLDSLLSLSDDLVKTTNLVEAVVAKVRRQLVELEGASNEEAEVRERAICG
jgi:V-type H+-transporting ATPase subunit C